MVRPEIPRSTDARYAGRMDIGKGLRRDQPHRFGREKVGVGTHRDKRWKVIIGHGVQGGYVVWRNRLRTSIRKRSPIRNIPIARGDRRIVIRIPGRCKIEIHQVLHLRNDRLLLLIDHAELKDDLPRTGRAR